MKKKLLAVFLGIAISTQAQAVRLENNYSDYVSFYLITPQLAGVYQDRETIGTKITPHQKQEVSILEQLKKARTELQELHAEREAYGQFEVQLGQKGDYHKCAIYRESNTRDDVALYLRDMTDIQLQDLDDNYKIEVSQNGTCAFRKK